MRDIGILQKEILTASMQNIPKPHGEDLLGEKTAAHNYYWNRFFLTTDFDDTNRSNYTAIKGTYLPSMKLYNLTKNAYKSIKENFYFDSVASGHEFEVYNVSMAIHNWTTTEDQEVPIKVSTRETDLPNNTVMFSLNHGLLSYLRNAIKLVEKNFKSIIDIELFTNRDPETDEEWIVIDVTLDEDIEDTLEQYDKYTEDWIDLAPWQEREKIRLSYNLIE